MHFFYGKNRATWKFFNLTLGAPTAPLCFRGRRPKHRNRRLLVPLTFLGSLFFCALEVDFSCGRERLTSWRCWFAWLGWVKWFGWLEGFVFDSCGLEIGDDEAPLNKCRSYCCSCFRTCIACICMVICCQTVCLFIFDDVQHICTEIFTVNSGACICTHIYIYIHVSISMCTKILSKHQRRT